MTTLAKIAIASAAVQFQFANQPWRQSFYGDDAQPTARGHEQHETRGASRARGPAVSEFAERLTVAHARSGPFGIRNIGLDAAQTRGSDYVHSRGSNGMELCNFHRRR